MTLAFSSKLELLATFKFKFMFSNFHLGYKKDMSETLLWHCGLLTHCGRVTQICVYTLQLCKTDDANLRF